MFQTFNKCYCSTVNTFHVGLYLLLSYFKFISTFEAYWRNNLVILRRFSFLSEHVVSRLSHIRGKIGQVGIEEYRLQLDHKVNI